MIYGTVLCLGDSLTYGARSEHQRGFPEELSLMLSTRFGQDWSCLNEGISGQTSTDILRRCFSAARAAGGLPGAKLATLMAGTNDSKNPRYPIDLYKDNMVQMLRIYRRFGLKAFLGTLPPVQPAVMPCFSSASNEWIARANEAIEELATGEGVILVDFRDMGDYLVDGVHFGHDGYKEMARRFAEAILHQQ